MAGTRADTISAPVNGNEGPLVDVGNVETAPTTRGGDLAVSKPDQTFSESGPLYPVTGIDQAVSVGLDHGVVETSHAYDPSGLPQEVADPVNTGRRMLTKNRKMLDIELSGDGVSAGNNVAGVAANAYGEGEDNGLHGTHIRPHGVDVTTTVAGEDTTGSAGVNPDCIGEVEGFDEGPACTYVNGK